MACYDTVPFGQTSDPWLQEVPLAVILTMEGSARIEGARALTSLCSRTLLQINAGWRKCAKPARVTSSAGDLIDAYRHVCMAYQDVPEPILILEDDALIMHKDRVAFRSVDDFIAKHADFDVYNLGCVGLFDLTSRGPHRRVRGLMGWSQAIIWSAAARQKYLKIYDATPKATHVDVHMISRFDRKFTHRVPLVVQLFPATENMSNWCYVCNGGLCERAMVRVYTCLLTACMRLHERPDAWVHIYRINAWTKRAVALVFVSLATAIYLVRQRRRTLMHR
jgi:hypothetical protein